MSLPHVLQQIFLHWLILIIFSFLPDCSAAVGRVWLTRQGRLPGDACHRSGCHQLLAGGRKTDELFKYFCIALMCSTFISACEYCALLLCRTESERVHHRGRYDWPALLFHPQHSRALSRARPENRSLIKIYITAQQMLSVAASLSTTAAALIGPNGSPWNHSVPSWFSTCGVFTVQESFGFFSLNSKTLVSILVFNPSPLALGTKPQEVRVTWDSALARQAPHQ